MFNFNAAGIEPSGGIYSAIPKGEYVLQIVDTIEKQSKNGNPQVVVTYKVHEGQYKGRRISFQHVTFLPKDSTGAGMAIHFLKSISEPWEGNFEVDHMRWRGKLVKALVIEEEYNSNINNKVKGIEPMENPNAATAEIENVPF